MRRLVLMVAVCVGMSWAPAAAAQSAKPESAEAEKRRKQFATWTGFIVRCSVAPGSGELEEILRPICRGVVTDFRVWGNIWKIYTAMTVDPQTQYFHSLVDGLLPVEIMLAGSGRGKRRAARIWVRVSTHSNAAIEADGIAVRRRPGSRPGQIVRWRSGPIAIAGSANEFSKSVRNTALAYTKTLLKTFEGARTESRR